MFDLRLLTGAMVSLVAFAFIGFQLIGGNAEVAALARGEAPRIELSVMEKPLPAQQHIKVPVWTAPPAELAVHLIPFLDTENDTKMEIAAVTVAKPKPLPPMIATADVEADTKADPIFVAAVTAPRALPQPALAKPEPTQTEAAQPPSSATEAQAILAKLNEADLEPTGSIALPRSIEAPEPRAAPPAPARPVVRPPVVQRHAARPAPPPATPQPLSPQPYSPQAHQQTQQTQPNPLAVLFPPLTPAGASQPLAAARPQPQPQPLFGNPAPAPASAPVKYPAFDRTAVGVLNHCCTPRAVIGGGE
jgi:hypothetical protein